MESTELTAYGLEVTTLTAIELGETDFVLTEWDDNQIIEDETWIQ